jgi:hypothetical protein
MATFFIISILLLLMLYATIVFLMVGLIQKRKPFIFAGIIIGSFFMLAIYLMQGAFGAR